MIPDAIGRGDATRHPISSSLSAIRDATLQETFELHYQGLFHVASSQLVGFEALLRLPGPDGELVPRAQLGGLQTMRFNADADARAAYFAKLAELDAKGYLDAIAE